MTGMTDTDPGVVDEALARIGRKRRLTVTTPRFTTVAFHVIPASASAICDTNLLITVSVPVRARGRGPNNPILKEPGFVMDR